MDGEFYKVSSTNNISGTQLEMVDKMKKELRLVDTQKLVPGHTLFECDLKTLEVRVAEKKSEIIMHLDGSTSKKQTVVIKPNCIYRQALNKKNVIKRLKREGYELE